MFVLNPEITGKYSEKRQKEQPTENQPNTKYRNISKGGGAVFTFSISRVAVCTPVPRRFITDHALLHNVVQHQLNCRQNLTRWFISHSW